MSSSPLHSATPRLLFVLLFITFQFALALDLTPQERYWVAEHPHLRFGADYRWPPFDFTDHEGKHTGIAAEYLRLIEERTGLRIEVEGNVWAQTLQKMRDGGLDGLTCTVETDERKAFLAFSEPYLSVPTAIVVQRQNSHLGSIESLFGKRVSINRGSYLHEWLSRRYPQIELYLSDSNEASLQAVAYGEADAYIGNLAVANYIINHQMLTNLTVSVKLEGMDTAVSLAVAKENTMLLSIIQKALSSITPEEHQRIFDHWRLESAKAPIGLSYEEYARLKKEEGLIVALKRDDRPYFWLDAEGRAQGIIIQIFEMLERESGVRLTPLIVDSRREALEALHNKRALLVFGAGLVEGVRGSEAFLKVPRVLITRDDIDYIDTLDGNFKQKVGALEEGEALHVRTLSYPDSASLLEALKQKKIDVAVLDSGRFEAHRDTLRRYNLKISGTLEPMYPLFFGADVNDPELISILNKALGALSQERVEALYRSHVTTSVKLFDYALMWRVFGLAVFMVVLIAAWNLKLSREIEKRKRVEAMLRASQEALMEQKRIAEDASRAKSEFLANMSHEIRTPMNAILGFSELLFEQVRDERLRGYLSTVRSAGNTLLMLINDILDLSKIEAGKMLISKQPLNPHVLFSDVGAIFTMKLREKGLDLLIEIDPQLPQSLLLDETRIRQILFNLLGNAVKFTDDGYIRLFAHKIPREGESRIDLVFGVEDTGMGIAQEQIERVFNLFEQQEGQSQAKYGGTGLGLAITKRLCEAMGGTIEVRSRVGEGSTFEVTLHNVDVGITVAQHECQERFDASRVRFGACRLMVVDDIENNRALLRENFAQMPVVLIEACDGVEAVEKAQKERPDAILMDLRMPGMNGYEAARRIKRLYDVPIIALTASVMEEEHQRMKGAQFDGYLRKPVLRSDLFETLCAFLPCEQLPKEETKTPMALRLSKEARADAALIVTALEGPLFDRYSAALKTRNIKETGAFAQELLALSQRYGLSELQEYSATLLRHADSFDIENLRRQMERYTTQIEAFKTAL